MKRRPYLCTWEDPNATRAFLADPSNDPSVDENFAIRYACTLGHTAVVQMLLEDPRVDPSVHDGLCLYNASGYNYWDVVKILLSDHRVDPSVRENGLLWNALVAKKICVVTILLAHPRLNPHIGMEHIITRVTHKGARILAADPRCGIHAHVSLRCLFTTSEARSEQEKSKKKND